MSELQLQFLAFGKVVAVALFGLLYGLGGTLKKWLRRYLGCVVYALFLWLFSFLQGTFSYWYFLTPLILMGALHKGYGGSTTPIKIKKRALVGALIALSGLPIAIVTANWILFGFHSVISFSAMVILGVWNPLRSARDEETLIGSLAVLFPMFMV